MTVEILGTEYLILKQVPENELPENADGCIDHTRKVIKIGLIKPEADTVADIGQYLKQVLRHEIIHGFLYESGLYTDSHYSDAWATDEEMIDWIAIQSPKIIKAFEQAGCL